MNAPETFGQRLTRLRTAANLTQGQLAFILGVSKPTVWAWEKDRARPILERFGDIATALGVEVEDIEPAKSLEDLRSVVERCRTMIAEAAATSADRVQISVLL